METLNTEGNVQPQTGTPTLEAPVDFLETLRALVEDSEFSVTFELEPRNSKWPAEKFCCDIDDDQGSDLDTGSGPDLLSALAAATAKVRRKGART